MFNKLYWGTAGVLGVVALLLSFNTGQTATAQPESLVVPSEIKEVPIQAEPTAASRPEPAAIQPSPVVRESLPVKSCHPSYSGCLNPEASDYDCAGGKGNGPYYTGPVRVIGYDEFDLDRDNDGWGCE